MIEDWSEFKCKYGFNNEILIFQADLFGKELSLEIEKNNYY